MFSILEDKTGKENILMVNKTVHKAIKKFLQKMQHKSDEFLFANQKGKGRLRARRLMPWSIRGLMLWENTGHIHREKPFGMSNEPSLVWSSKYWPSVSTIQARRLRYDILFFYYLMNPQFCTVKLPVVIDQRAVFSSLTLLFVESWYRWNNGDYDSTLTVRPT